MSNVAAWASEAALEAAFEVEAGEDFSTCPFEKAFPFSEIDIVRKNDYDVALMDINPEDGTSVLALTSYLTVWCWCTTRSHLSRRWVKCKTPTSMMGTQARDHRMSFTY